MTCLGYSLCISCSAAPFGVEQSLVGVYSIAVDLVTHSGTDTQSSTERLLDQ